MKRLLLVCVASLAFATASARPLERQVIGAEQDRSVAATGGDDCESFFRTTFTSFAAQARGQEQRELDLSGVQQVRVAAAREGGISIRGWNRPTAKLVICRYAVANTQEHATRALGGINVSSRNGEIAVQGPQIDATQAWWVNMTLYVPRRANIDVRAGNGAVAIRNMTGRVSAESATGGISVAQSSGKYTIKTDSGGITLDRVTGLVDAVSRGGAIAFKLAGTALPSIEAKTGDGHIVCTLKGCDAATPAAGGGNRLRIGDGVPDVRLSSMGGSIWIGPVTY
jgi:hypothetical protein